VETGSLTQVGPDVMMLRKLRIAWSVFWPVSTVLLIVLWVRSYTWDDSVSGPTPGGYGYLLESIPSRLEIQLWNSIFPANLASYRLTELSAKGIEAAPFTGWGFGFYKRPNYLIIHLPYWFLITVAGTFSTTPWLHWRFSLRALLIATTLVAVVLGLIVWLSR
jgi:hypothetical protein